MDTEFIYYIIIYLLTHILILVSLTAKGFIYLSNLGEGKIFSHITTVTQELSASDWMEMLKSDCCWKTGSTLSLSFYFS